MPSWPSALDAPEFGRVGCVGCVGCVLSPVLAWPGGTATRAASAGDPPALGGFPQSDRANAETCAPPLPANCDTQSPWFVVVAPTPPVSSARDVCALDGDRPCLPSPVGTSMPTLASTVEMWRWATDGRAPAAAMPDSVSKPAEAAVATLALMGRRRGTTGTARTRDAATIAAIVSSVLADVAVRASVRAVSRSVATPP
ncbi:MAG: hypothetical protein E6G06_00230 [Actinobacteria bacterium]|nr:MAG: hypothetical protein E6G06_00230 [Actinomycetota bacterium]